MEHFAYAVIAAFVLAYGLISKRLENTFVTDPMVFVFFGLLLSAPVLGLVTDKDHVFINTIANLTLILVLFSDASRIDLPSFWKQGHLALRLLAIGLPLTIVVGFLAALIVFAQLPIWQAAILATILAPTDAALAQAVINLEIVPPRVREALNVESGLNDGICLPFLLLFISLASAAEQVNAGSYWIMFVIDQLVLGPVAGIFVGYLGGKFVLWAIDRDWMAENYQRLSGLSLSIVAFFVAEGVDGNGFMACFFAGLVFGNVARKVSRAVYEFAEAEGQLLILLTFMLFGAVMLPQVSFVSGWRVFAYGLFSLTAARMIPVMLSLAGKGLSAPGVVFMGWFGPRGAASILYVLLVVDQHDFSGESIIFQATAMTVVLSVFLHGLTAVSGARAYAGTLGAQTDGGTRPG